MRLFQAALSPSFGALGLGGIAAFVFGAIIMFDTDVPGYGISYTFVIGIAMQFLQSEPVREASSNQEAAIASAAGSPAGQ